MWKMFLYFYGDCDVKILLCCDVFIVFLVNGIVIDYGLLNLVLGGFIFGVKFLDFFVGFVVLGMILKVGFEFGY